MSSSGKHMFEKFKELGLYSSHVGHVLTTTVRGSEYLVISAVGRHFYVIGCKRLTKYNISNEHPSDIECLAANRRYIFTGCDNVVRVFRNKHRVERELTCDADVKCILPMMHHVVAVDSRNNLKMWLVETGSETLHIPFNTDDFDVTCIIHPNNYTNKIVLGSRQGTCQLWNVAKAKMLYEFKLTDGNAITCMADASTGEAASCSDVIAVGTEQGVVLMLNLRTAEVLFELKHDMGSIRSLAFLLNNKDDPILIGGTAIGHICFWHLKDGGSLRRVKESAHKCAVSSVTVIRDQNTFITNSSDNSIKMWQFDVQSFTESLLRDRTGHFGDLSRVKFYDDERVLSAGFDSTVRLYSCLKENRNKSLGKATMGKKNGRNEKLMPPIVDFQFEKSRERHWDGMIAVHQRHIQATTWNVTHARIGSHKFLHERFSDRETTRKMRSKPVVTTADLTACGNFSLLGYSSGDVDIYNMQSGRYQGSFMVRGESAHHKSVIGVGVDSINQVAVTVGEDKRVCFWNFKKRRCLVDTEKRQQACKVLDETPMMAKLHRDSSMVAIVLQNFQIVVVDLDTREIVRKFCGFYGSVDDLVWSNDGLLLITATSDCMIRIWDLSLSRMVDCFSVDNPVTSLSLSPNSSLLATSHTNSSSIHLWSNSSLYGLTSYQPELDDDDDVMVFDGNDDDDRESSNLQLESNLLTQSELPASRWVNLADLETIRRRNKPKQAVKKITSAPFFLDVPDANSASNDDKAQEKPVVPFNVFSLSPFAQTLDGKTHGEMLAYMKSLGPSAIDSGIRSLTEIPSRAVEFINKFLLFIKDVMETRKDFEVIQAYLQLFLKTHTEAIIASRECVQVLAEIQALNDSLRKEFTSLLDQSLTCTNFIKTSFI